ncbi:MAG: family 16 glycoside hydrolase, partial [Akkermansiaceae bacterium]
AEVAPAEVAPAEVAPAEVAPAEVAPAEVAPAGAATALFNGINLDGWSHVLVGDGVTKEDVWSVEDGILVCKGQPLGYLLTNGSYQDFTLSLEWRWLSRGEPGNSGVLLRIAGEPATFMPKCVEAQLKQENAGDVWGFFGASLDGPTERIHEVKDHETLGDFKGVKKMKAAEKPPGEWNHYEIKVSGGDLELKVNGELVNQASGLDVLSGPIGLQSEGAEIHFRNIRLEQTNL